MSLNAVASVKNLELAYARVLRGSNGEYKKWFRHLYPSVTLAAPVHLQRLSASLRKGTYRPGSPTLVYQPKKSGVLRPISLLSVDDQIVYQALVNRIADAMQKDQEKHALTRRFGALYSGKGNEFFFRPWKTAYSRYNGAIKTAFDGGRTWVAEFDLVSCYELIDHNLLRASLAVRVRDADVLDLLCKCLGVWTTNASGNHVRHGVPQGPEASAFLAECVLAKFDDLSLKDVTYLRYVDDIRLLAKDEVPIRQSMLRLDLLSKDLGLVPQALKLGVKQYKSVQEILKTVPSALVKVRPSGTRVGQRELMRMWRKSLVKVRNQWDVDDPTRFRFATYRLTGRRQVLRRNASLLLHRPDLAATLSYYFRHFPQDREAADLLLGALRQNPTYDFAAAAYIDALHVCEPTSKKVAYRKVVRTAWKRSVEKSLLLRAAALRFRVSRAGIADASQLLAKESDTRVRALALAAVCAGAGGSPFTVDSLRTLLRAAAADRDPDLARFAAAMLVAEDADAGGIWKAPKAANGAVVDLLVALGLRRRGNARKTAVEVYLERVGVIATLNWKKALGSDVADVERRAVRLEHLRVTDPTAFVLMLDTFNETLVYALARRHPSLSSPFLAAAGGNAIPDFGNWVRNGAFTKLLPQAAAWLLAVHEVRVGADLAHAKHKKGTKKGQPTAEVTHEMVAKLLRQSKRAWTEIIHAWQPLL